MIINKHIRNIHRKTLNYIHLARKIRAEHTQSSHTRQPNIRTHPPANSFFLQKKIRNLNQSKVNNNDQTIVLD